MTTEQAPRTETLRPGDNLVQARDLKMYFPVTSGIIFQRKIADVKAEVDRLTAELSLGRMEAIKLVAKRLGLPKQEVYRRVAVPGSSSPDKRRG